MFQSLVQLVRRYPRNSFLTIVFFPVLLWAVLEETKESAPWQIMIPAGTFGWALGMFFYSKVVSPFFRFTDKKIATFLGFNKLS